jgi:hypothetical protein
MTIPKEPPAKDLPTQHTDDDVASWFREALRREAEDIEKLPKRFKPGEGIIDVEDDGVITP